MSADMPIAPVESHAEVLTGSDGGSDMGTQLFPLSADLSQVFCGPPAHLPSPDAVLFPVCFGPMAEYPLSDVDLYPVHCGPATFYPAEARASVEYGAFCGPSSWDPGAMARSRIEPREVQAAAPPPIVDSAWTHEHWPEEWFPSMVQAFARRARAAGLEARVGFSRGWVPGRAAGTFVIRDLIGCWVNGRGGRLVMLWERDPDAPFSARKLEKGVEPGEIPSGQMWKCKGGHVVNGLAGMSQAEVSVWMEGAR